MYGGVSLAHLYDAVADSAVRLPADQQQADDHHHGDGHGHHQQPHHGASVERLQGVGLLWTEETWALRPPENGLPGKQPQLVLTSYQLISLDLRRLVHHLLQLQRRVDLRGRRIRTRNETDHVRFWDPHLSVVECAAFDDQPFPHTHKWGLFQMWCSRIHPQTRLAMEGKQRVRTQGRKMKGIQSTPKQPIVAAHLSCWTAGLWGTNKRKVWLAGSSLTGC